MQARTGILAVFALSVNVAVSGCVTEVSEVGSVNRDLPVATTGETNLPLGAVCFTGDEWVPDFGGLFGHQSIVVVDDRADCASSICLANHFQGRANCPYGQAAPSDPQQQESPPCELPDGRARVSVAVPPQFVDRRADAALYCSCRCAGPEGTGPFCTCPAGFECEHLVEDLGLTPPGHNELAGSYCIKAGTAYDAAMSTETCDWQTKNCGPG